MRIDLNCDAASGAHCNDHLKCEALSHMLQALDRLDSDPGIPPIIGAQLQYAIDLFCAEYSIELPQPNIH
jgi:hypothetical protein